MDDPVGIQLFGGRKAAAITSASPSASASQSTATPIPTQPNGKNTSTSLPNPNHSSKPTSQLTTKSQLATSHLNGKTSSNQLNTSHINDKKVSHKNDISHTNGNISSHQHPTSITNGKITSKSFTSKSNTNKSSTSTSTSTSTHPTNHARKRKMEVKQVESDENDDEMNEEDEEENEQTCDNDETHEEKSGITETAISWSDLELSPWLLKILTEMGLRHPTSIQSRAIPEILAGHDVIGQAKTGSGKTASFALPILHTLSSDPYGVYALVLTPTRELAYQIADQFHVLGQPMGLRTIVCVGGMDMLQQSIELTTAPHVIIATPGRLADHITSHTEIRGIHNVRYLVLDEVDRLMETCFDDAMDTILSLLPAQRQNLLFSATMEMNDEILQRWNVKDPKYIKVTSDEDAFVKSLDQRYIFIPQNVKECYLIYILTHIPHTSSIIFTSTCRGAEIISQLLMELSIDCVSLHSRKNQARRMAALGKFRSGRVRVMVATDVASRGLDIPTVQLVVNYDVPRLTTDYLHRVGRTARAGRGGLALTLVSQYDISIFQAIESFVGTRMTAYEVKESEVLDDLKRVNAAKRMAKIRLEEFELTSKTVKRHPKRAKPEFESNASSKSVSSKQTSSKNK